MIEDGDNQGAHREALLARLTAGEIRCLEQVAKGLQTKEIARALELKPNTVDTWLRSAVRKLGTRNRFLAAQMLMESRAKDAATGDVTPVPLLRPQYSHIPADANPSDREPSAGEGNGPDDLGHGKIYHPESRDSGDGTSWLEPSHPIARFFGGENRLSWGQRLLRIIAIAIGASIAFTAVMNSLLAVSRLLASSN